MAADLDSASTRQLSQCLKKMCGIDLCKQVLGVFGFDDKIKKQIEVCVSKIEGHVENVVEITDATDREVGKHVFAVIEPQIGNPTRATQCTWTQASATPVIPDDCKKKVLERHYGADAFMCELSWKWGIVDCNVPVAGDPGYSSSSSSSRSSKKP